MDRTDLDRSATVERQPDAAARVCLPDELRRSTQCNQRSLHRKPVGRKHDQCPRLTPRQSNPCGRAAVAAQLAHGMALGMDGNVDGGTPVVGQPHGTVRCRPTIV